MGANDMTQITAGCIFADNHVGGGDLVYSFTAPESRNYTLWVVPSLGYDVSIVRMSGACGADHCAELVDEELAGKLEVKTFSMTAGETTWFLVDGWATSPTDAGRQGFFRMQVR